MPLFSDLVLEGVGGFESRDVMSRDDERGIFADVAGCLLDTGLYDEGTETSKIYIFTVCQTVLHNGHELFNH